MLRKQAFSYFIILILILSSTAHGEVKPADKTVLTLEKAISIAKENNRDILLAKEGSNRADQQIREAKSGAYPQLSFVSQYRRTLQKPVLFVEFGGEKQKFELGFDNTFMSTFTANQLLYSGGKMSTAVKIASKVRQSMEANRKQVAKNVILDVKTQFYGVLLSREVLKINQRGLELAEAHLKNITAMFNNGVASEFDLLRAEVQVANARPKVISSGNSLELQMNLIKNVIGIPLDTEIDIQGELIPDFIDETVIEATGKTALENRDDYRNLSLIRDAYLMNVKIERGNKFPILSANYTYTFQGESNNFAFDSNYSSQAASLNFSLPLFDGFRTSSRVQQARITVKETDYQLIKLKEGIEIQITQSKNAMDNARKRMESTDKTVEQAERAYNISRTRFESGQGTQLEIFDAQMALELSQLNRLQSVFDYEIAKAQWENAVGR